MKYWISLPAALMLCCVTTVSTESQIKKDTPITSMISATTGAQALEGGIEILKQGGNAMDAALSTALSQVVLAAGSWVSYAGLINLVYYDASTGKVYNMNASFNTVKNEMDAMTIPGSVSLDFSQKANATNGRSVLVPGFMAGVEEAHRKFGKLSFADIFKNAISIAENGFTWSEGLQYQYNYRKDILSRLPETNSVFTKSDGTGYAVGDLFFQPALAHTLRNVVKYGSAYMYSGPWADKFVKVIQAEGGKLTIDDLKNYKVMWNEPLVGNYKHFDMYIHGFPAIGGVNTIEALNLMEFAKLDKKPLYYEDPAVLHELSDIIRIGDIAPYLGDALKSIPSLDFTLKGRLKKENAPALYELLKLGYFSGAAPQVINTPKHSDAIVTVDKYGNMCAMTHSLNAVSWGGTGIFIDGVSIPDPASFQQAEVAKAGPGNRLPDPTNPGIVLKNGKPVMGFASIGAGLHAKTITCLLGVMGYSLNPQQAVDLPGLEFILPQPDGSLPRTIDTTEFKKNVISKANALGGGGFVHNLTMPGYWVGILRDSTGTVTGSTVPKLGQGGRAVGF